jgi:hypothetical protein
MIEILKPNVTFSAVNYCIYCNATDVQLTDEHVIPFGLGGTVVLPKASCKACAGKTAALEQTIQRMILGSFRIRMGLPTRRKKERPTELEFYVSRGSRVTKKLIPIAEFPLVYHAAKLPAPRILLGLPPTDRLDYEAVAIMNKDVIDEHLNKPGKGFSPGVFEPIIFFRFLAKIAHSCGVGRFGAHSFKPALPDMILGKPDVLINSCFQYIGGGMPITIPKYEDSTLKTLHALDTRIAVVGGARYAVVSIQLFSFLNAPTYDVIVGQLGF